MQIEIDSTIYCLEAVQKAAYRFIDRLTIFISRNSDLIICEIELIPGSKKILNDVVADFKRELLDQQLRHRIKIETEPSRNLILALAFSQAAVAE